MTTQENTDISVINTDNPLYIHSTDLTGVKLVATPFDGTNFPKNKIGFIDGSLPKPVANATTARNWQRCNDIVFSWIINSVSPEIGDFILHSATAQEAWAGRNFKKDFSQGNDSVVTYFTKLKSIWDEINGMGMNPKCSCGCTCGAKEKQIKFQEYKKAVEFLMGLNNTYAVVRGTILMQNPLPKIAVIYNNLLQEERQREIDKSILYTF
ncbi:uncharacterized protein LOC141641618 [Silene latifolia]|uniref:uncharacterized protein LOC141641618 n=1 Tax=Silene latifolia TaxID=37657 RepID=UPI003D7828B6